MNIVSFLSIMVTYVCQKKLAYVSMSLYTSIVKRCVSCIDFGLLSVRSSRINLKISKRPLNAALWRSEELILSLGHFLPFFIISSFFLSPCAYSNTINGQDYTGTGLCRKLGNGTERALAASRTIYIRTVSS